MENFEAKTICILGRQPELGLAELESLYGPGRIVPLNGAALLDIPAEDIDFQRLGGTIKVARVLTELDKTDWKSLSGYIIDKVPGHTEQLPKGKFTLGLSITALMLRPARSRPHYWNLKNLSAKPAARYELSLTKPSCSTAPKYCTIS